jgi:hypothetical protein
LAETVKTRALTKCQDLSITPPPETAGSDFKSYPFRNLLWLPLIHRDGHMMGGLLLAREQVWGEAERIVPERLAATYAHALQMFAPKKRVWTQWLPAGRAAAVVALVAAALMFLPVPMTTLAPFEVGSSQSVVVAAPMDGVIEDIAVEANATVKKGDILVRLNDISLRNRLEIAEHEVAVAHARMLQTTQLAFGEARGRHDLGIARAEHELKAAERDYARELLEKSVIRAVRDGIAVYADKRSLLGKPVTTGERIMDLADPSLTELRIDVAAGDAISVQKRLPLTAFFDADPLNARAGRVRHADYQARGLPNGGLAFRVTADLDDGLMFPPRLGSRGIAQLSGEDVPLAFYLFRRPLTALRQRFGS